MATLVAIRSVDQETAAQARDTVSPLKSDLVIQADEDTRKLQEAPHPPASVSADS